MIGSPTGINPDALHQLIAVRAYQMWEDQGRPHGCADQHWRQAEQDILACLPESEASAPAQAAKGAASRTASVKR